MSNIVTLYFSGTGNTSWVVHQLADRLVALGDTVHLLSCETSVPDDLRIADAQMLGVVFPVYGSYAPYNLRDFLAQLPPVNNIPLFVIAVPAIFGGDTAWYTARPLSRKGYTPFLYANVHMPNNIYPVPDPVQVNKMLAKSGAKITRLAPMIHERHRHLEGMHLLGWLGGYMQRPGMSWIENRAQGLFFADETCTRCGWCADHCPAGNIELTAEGVQFGRDCLFCLRCFHRCPQKAIQITKWTRNTTRFRRYPGPE